jgi:hypothetical protein
MTLARLLNPIMPKVTRPLEIVATIIKFGTPVNAAMNPDVTRATQLDTFKITN